MWMSFLRYVGIILGVLSGVSLVVLKKASAATPKSPEWRHLEAFGGVLGASGAPLEAFGRLVGCTLAEWGESTAATSSA